MNKIINESNITEFVNLCQDEIFGVDESGFMSIVPEELEEIMNNFFLNKTE